MSEEFYAHSKEGEQPDHWQPLEEHLNNVAKLASSFATPFGGDQWAYLAGLWHDLGKYSSAFQKMLYEANGIETHIEAQPGRPIHSEAGGHLAALKSWPPGFDRLLAWLIMGHHTGLADFAIEKAAGKALKSKLEAPERSKTILQHVPDTLKNQNYPETGIPKGANPAFFIRMLFSCLVDADFLDTEAFLSPENNKKRLQNTDFTLLKLHFDDFMAKITQKAPKTPVNQVRSEVLKACRTAGQQKPSVFSLTVPTGGGKTLSSLAFALEHAVKHQKDRIIYVIPYTSIIEQTANVFRSIPGLETAVLEHHSNIDYCREDAQTRRNRLAAENWDAPIIVTTSEQFFESLYAAKTSRCRKLHNIVNSVIIFDEAQCLPPPFLRPCVFAIRELHRHYHVTPVLCTATQPVLTQTRKFDFNFAEGFENVHEIIPDPETLANRLKRVEIEGLGNFSVPTDLETLKNAILNEKTPVLCIVNRKEDARNLARSLPADKTIHLSTNMCAKHRFSVLSDIKTRLKEQKDPFFVISTSLVEAGVDLDFPVVYRALAGLDSIAQAAGRCNREGKRPEPGRVVVFLPENQPNYVKNAAQIAREALATGFSDLLSPKIIKKYFITRFWQLGTEKLDEKDVLSRLSGPLNYSFRSVADDFHLISDECRPVIAPDPEAQAIIDKMLSTPSVPARVFIRQLQPYIVNIPRFEYDRLLERDYIHIVPEMPDVTTLNPILYDKKYGYIPRDEQGNADPTQTII